MAPCPSKVRPSQVPEGKPVRDPGPSARCLIFFRKIFARPPGELPIPAGLSQPLFCTLRRVPSSVCPWHASSTRNRRCLIRALTYPGMQLRIYRIDVRKIFLIAELIGKSLRGFRKRRSLLQAAPSLYLARCVECRRSFARGTPVALAVVGVSSSLLPTRAAQVRRLRSSASRARKYRGTPP